MQNTVQQEIKNIQEELKIQRALLATLDIQFKHSPYNQNPEAIQRKKHVIMEKIKKLEQLRNEKLDF